MSNEISIKRNEYVSKTKDELLADALNKLKNDLIALTYETYGVELKDILSDIRYKNFDTQYNGSVVPTNDTILYGIVKYDKDISERSDMIETNNGLGLSVAEFVPNFNGWDIHKALLSMNNGALVTKKSRGQCAKAVRSFIEAGGISTEGRPVSAYKYVSYLPTKGFRHIAKLEGTQQQQSFRPQPGDISVMAHGKHGHICMWNGSQWVSDFPQNNMWPYKGEGVCDIFRFQEA